MMYNYYLSLCLQYCLCDNNYCNLFFEVLRYNEEYFGDSVYDLLDYRYTRLPVCAILLLDALHLGMLFFQCGRLWLWWKKKCTGKYFRAL